MHGSLLRIPGSSFRARTIKEGGKAMTTVLKMACAALLIAAGCAAAQPYPSQPIKLIAPFPPGGSVDITARLLADPRERRPGGRIITQNPPGPTANFAREPPPAASPDGVRL